ncbi:Multisubunit Na+/H+ antiporter, MnhG subunit [Halalkaliarchaeum sp. AArc-CO]|uniref:monovalent cation/H(+) antiporter subunit G n=1 Tax=unclassified Halalkaliarchaeum TaxID=2678344 RepID=UPI00217D7E33|nr:MULTISPECIES: monovalent cation/H(+) antiporter subunit G [unclassified Halalkaliarchaeum]MDR5672456.1 monovalent cation/H(+) antiporter subunit G [Halalkaliarchaeum sp. AArc-GB]UWG49915.1 Multisubunit Na+/H+ antiporter, MnhG subunit [Halalkaliarchaeum sp. AArc-CO]
MTIQTAVVIGLTAAAVFFTFVGAVGLLRLPDIYTRAHAASKADTLGAGFAVAAVAIHFGVQIVVVKMLLLLVFIYITNPTASHAISRAAYLQDAAVWIRTEDGSGELVSPRSDVDESHLEEQFAEGEGKEP